MDCRQRRLYGSSGIGGHNLSLLENISQIYLEEVVGDRFGRYSKYIIQDRAIPDVRDGLKPVQRRILYSMYDSGNTPDKSYRKSAKTVGDVMGNYHPHGDTSIYDGMVRMAQPWKMRHVLVDGHGNWGSQDDDPPAAMRYTEARLSPIAMELLKDIEKNTVRFQDNFDNSTQEPTVLPSRYPNLLVNGVSGISSGFATEIPPHNLREVVNGCIALINNPDLTTENVMTYIQGPDFPTGGTIMGGEGIANAYKTGKGKIYIRAKTVIDVLKGGRQQIVITEIPYQVVKSRLVTSIDNLKLEKKVEGIAEVRDESGRNGLRIVIELKKEADAEGILNFLYKKTDLQVVYNFNIVAIVDKAPVQLGLKEMLTAYIAHQIEIVTKRSEYELDRYKDRAHVIDGLIRALSILDEVIQTIKQSNNRLDAQQQLMKKYDFTERQADAILVLQLYRLTNLEITSLEKESLELNRKISYLESILSHEGKLRQVIVNEMKQISDTYGNDRRSIIQDEVEVLKVNVEVTVAPEDVIVVMTAEGYMKRTSFQSYTRSGAEVGSIGLKEGDAVTDVIKSNTLDSLLLFTKKGHYYLLPVHQIPEYKWKDAGTAIVNVIPIPKDDRVAKIINVKDINDDITLLFFTRKGQVKRTSLNEYYTTRSNAVSAIKLGAEDEVIDVQFSKGNQEILLVSKKGMAIRFLESEVNNMGRNTMGVRGINLQEDDEVADVMLVYGDEGEILTMSDRTYAKRSFLFDYPIKGRGGKGQLTFEFKETARGIKKNGDTIMRAFYVKEAYDIVCITTEQSVTMNTEKVKIEERRSPGKEMVKMNKDESLKLVFKKPEQLEET